MNALTYRPPSWGSVIPLAEDYENAVEILDGDGWTQGHLRDESGYCLAGAVTEAVRRRLGLPYVGPGTIKWMALAIDGEFGEEPDEGIAAWNDAPNRTKLEVQDRLMLAAKNRRNEGR